MPQGFDISSLAGAAQPYAALASAAGSVIGGVMQMIQSGKEKREARNLEKNLVRPLATIQKPILDNQALAESLGSQGLSDQALEVYRSSSDRKLGNSVNAILMGGGSVNNIADLYDTSQQNDQHIALLEEEVRQKNMQNLMKQNETLAGEQEKKWMINEYAPYQDTKQLIAQLKNQSNQNKWGGINTMIGGLTNYASSGLMADGGTSASDSGRAQTTNVINPVQHTTPSVSTGFTNTNPLDRPNPVMQNYYLDMLKRRSFAQ